MLIILEGASGAYLPSIAKADGIDAVYSMDKLDAIGKEGIAYNRFVVHQRNTNRGTYSLLCGDYPKLTRSISKFNEFINIYVRNPISIS